MNAAPVNILDALNDPALFRPHFKGDTWTAWEAFLAALFALPMDDAQLALYRHHTGRHTPPTEVFKEAALVCGRRGGKSRVLALVAVFLACFREYSPHLAPGEVATIAIIAADRKKARTVMRYVTGLLCNVPMLAEMIENEREESFTLSNSVTIEIFTASFRVTRGYSLIAALCDEIAFWRSDDTAANPDTEILRAIRPAMSNLPGAMLLLASSPYSKRGALYAAFRKHWAQDGARVLVWRGTTQEMNPRIDPAIIAEAEEEDPANAAAEYHAQFRDDIAAFVTREAVDACVAPGRFELPRITGIHYSAFVDPSGGSADSMTLAIAHREKDRVILDAVRERKPPFSPKSVVEEFAAMLTSYGINRVTGDRYAGEWPREVFRDHGISYELSEKPKSDLYRDMLPLLNSARVELLDLPRLTGQLCNLERRTARGGRDSIDHAPGAHDDIANAVAGAVLLVGSARQPMNINPEVAANFGKSF